MPPDVSAVSQSRWEALTPEQRHKILPLCPDFVPELRSQSDRLKDCHKKMNDWMANGCQLSWLIDVENLLPYVYEPNQEPQEIVGLSQLLSEDVLPGFVLDLTALI